MFEIKSVETKVIWCGDYTSFPLNRYDGGSRNSYILHYVRRGKGYLEVAGKTHTICAGDSFVIYPDIPIKYYPDKNDPWEYVWVNFVGMSVKNTLACMDVSIKQPVFPKTDESPEEIFDSICKTYRTETNISVRYLKLLAYLYTLFAFYTTHYPCVAAKPDLELFEKAISLVDENLSQSNYNVTSLAADLNLSRTTLFRLFKKQLDKSPIEYINELKISRLKSS